MRAVIPLLKLLFAFTIVWSPQQHSYVQEYRRRFNLDPLVKQVSREEEVLQHQGRTRATVRPAAPIHNRIWLHIAVSYGSFRVAVLLGALIQLVV